MGGDSPNRKRRDLGRVLSTGMVFAIGHEKRRARRRKRRPRKIALQALIMKSRRFVGQSRSFLQNFTWESCLKSPRSSTTWPDLSLGRMCRGQKASTSKFWSRSKKTLGRLTLKNRYAVFTKGEITKSFPIWFLEHQRKDEGRRKQEKISLLHFLQRC